jgi:hypothetical protein
VRVHTLGNEFSLNRIVDTNLDIVTSLLAIFSFRLLDQDLDDAIRLWLKLNDIILLMVDSVDISDVELTRSEFIAILKSIKIIRKVNPSAFLIENSWLQSTSWEVSVGFSAITIHIVMFPVQELMNLLRIINSTTRAFSTIWVSQLRVLTIITIFTSVFLITSASNILP